MGRPRLNPYFHFHEVVDGLFERIEGDPGPDSPFQNHHLRFHEASVLTSQLLEDLQHTVRERILRHLGRQGFLEPHEVQVMLGRDHGGGFGLDASVRIEARGLRTSQGP